MDATEARVVAKAVCDGPRQAFDVRQVGNMVQEFLNSFGDLLSWKVSSAEFPELEIQVEYYDTVAAQNALRTNPFKQAVSVPWNAGLPHLTINLGRHPRYERPPRYYERTSECH